MEDVIGAWEWLTTGSHWSEAEGVWQRLGEHLYLTGVCLGLAALLALPLALWLGHIGRGGALAVNISNVGRAVPTFAVLVLLTLGPLGEHGDWPTVIALVLFAVPPLLTNTYVGMREADRDVVEAARGMGMSGGQLLWRVELPLAYPLIMTGIRSASVQVVATATLAALPGGGGLGRIVTAGFNNYDNAQVVAGAVLVAVLAMLVEGVLVVADRLLDPMRRSAGGRPAARRRRAARTGVAAGAKDTAGADDAAGAKDTAGADDADSGGGETVTAGSASGASGSGGSPSSGSGASGSGSAGPRSPRSR